MTNEEWGPWIEHDGNGCPLSLGTYTEEVGVTPSGAPSHGFGHVKEYEIPCWDWSQYRKPSFGYLTGKVLRYRIRKPRALQQLREIAKNVREGVDA